MTTLPALDQQVAQPPLAERVQDLLDRHAGRLFVLPAVLLILAFSLFPLIISAWLSVSAFRLTPGGYDIRFVGLLNFRKMFVGTQQFHLLGTFARSRLSAGS